MKTSKLQLVDYRKPFRVGFHSPQIHRRTAESVFLKLTFDNGCCGFGECAPRPYVTGEDCQTVSDAIGRQAAPLLFAAAIESLDDIVRLMGKIEAKCRAETNGPFLSVLTVVELALLDALGRYTHASIAEILGRPPGRQAKRSISIPFLSTDHIQALFDRLRPIISIDAVKILMKTDLQENVQRVAFIRSMIGPELPLRIEANGKWSFEDALTHSEALAPYGVAAIEEPMHAADPQRLRELRDRIGIDIILDESVCSLEDARKMAAAKACDGFNLKLSKCGGLLKLMALADFAGQHQLKCHLGTHVGEGPVLDAAGWYAALGHAGFGHYEGYSSLLFLDLNRDPDILRRLTAPPSFTGHGLGVDPSGLEPLFDSPQAVEIVP
jgi:L-alanine-DL-glutamate epimerase-like enolase superfamily enzyme